MLLQEAQLSQRDCTMLCVTSALNILLSHSRSFEMDGQTDTRTSCNISLHYA